MATKSKSRKTRRPAAAASQPHLSQAVVDSAQKIWLAGLGAFARAKNEGDKMFEVLVQQGRKLRGQAREAADQALKSVRTQADATVNQAQGKWDKLEQVFEDRVSRSLNRLGVLTSKDVEELAHQVADLNDSVRALMGGPRGAAKRPAKKAARTRKTRKAAK